jgi:hypothetical protein
MPPAPPAVPPSDPSDFDFWVGEWEVTWPHEGRGRNVISRVLNDRVILEEFDGGPDSGFRGMSVSTISPETGVWHQTWVDSDGGYLDFRGGMRDGEMILEREATRDGATFRQRMVWTAIAPDSLEWRWQRSTDEGATWETVWPISYRRASAP